MHCILLRYTVFEQRLPDLLSAKVGRCVLKWNTQRPLQETLLRKEVFVGEVEL